MKKIVTVIVAVSLLLLVSASAPITSNAAERLEGADKERELQQALQKARAAIEAARVLWEQEKVEGEREQQQALQRARAAVEAARVLWERTLRVSEGNMSSHVIVLLGKPHNAGLQNNGSAWYRYQAGGLHVTILFNRDKVEKVDIVSRTTDVTRVLLAEAMSIFRDMSRENAWFSEQMDQGVTPLHFFAGAGSVEGIKNLVFAGVNVNVTCKEGLTPLHWAVEGGGVEADRLLIARLLISVGANVNSMDKQGITPLHRAVMEGHVEFVRLLLSEKANVNARTRYGHTPLHYAAIEGDIRIARLLVSAGASVNVTERKGVTPLGFAIGLRNTAMIQYLRSRGATR